MIQTAFFKFNDSLNDFLSAGDKDKAIKFNFTGTPAIKDSIEALGVPHTEVDAIVVNGAACDFQYKLNNDDKVEVYPPNTNFHYLKTRSLTPNLHYPLAFVADVHLGKLAKALRILGFDTIYENDISDKTIVEVAEKEQRIVLTRDIGLLKHKSIKSGYWLRNQLVDDQLQEVIRRFDLVPQVRLFKRCLVCNGEIEEVTKEAVLERLPPKTIMYFNEFFQCSVCNRVYWKGSHYDNMLEMLKRNLRQ